MSHEYDSRKCANCGATIKQFTTFCSDCRQQQHERRLQVEAEVDERIDGMDFDFTPNQRRTIRRILIEGMKSASGPWFDYKDKYEFKTIHVEELSYGGYQVRVIVGRKDDVGTLNEVFSRSRGQFFVGKKGGVSFYRMAKKGGGTVRVRGTRKIHRGFTY